jgi:hypothetical protein
MHWTTKSDTEIQRIKERQRLGMYRAIEEGRWNPTKGLERSRRTLATTKAGLLLCHNAWEIQRAKALDASPLVLSFRHEPFRIAYTQHDRKRKYAPDFLIRFTNGSLVLEELLRRPQHAEKFEAAKQWAKLRGFHFRILNRVELLSRVLPGPPPTKSILNPFRPQSIQGQVFKLLLRGCSISKLVRFVEDRHANGARLFRLMREGYARQFTWELKESRSRVRITNVQREG